MTTRDTIRTGTPGPPSPDTEYDRSINDDGFIRHRDACTNAEVGTHGTLPQTYTYPYHTEMASREAEGGARHF